MRKLPDWVWVAAPLGLFMWWKWYSDPVRQQAAATAAALAAGMPPPPPPGASAQALIEYQQAVQQAQARQP